jgi:PKHD-type hydroxylase
MTPLHLLPGALSPEDCERLTAAVAAQAMRDGVLVGGTRAPDLRRADVAWVDDLPDGAWVMERMVALVARANREAFGFDLTEFGESAQVARYGAERAGHFGWHSDIGAGAWAARRKLTVVVQLSDPAAHAGGELELWPDAAPRAVPRARGMAAVFPSFVLHRVTPVTKGERWSLTLWAHGPAFR